MLKNILKLDGTQILSNIQKKQINGGGICKSLYIAVGAEGDGDLSCIISISGQTFSGTIQNGKCCTN